ncbi:MAG TPA: reverse transcriptase family protein [Bryobacteraceae bacterium]|nr:reverse transcriptase family protein [Bryobacteraceae bacterium]
MANRTVLSALAGAFVEGDQAVDAVVERASHTLGRNWRWLRPLARRYLTWAIGDIRPRRRDVVDFFLRDRSFRRVWSQYFEELRVAQWLHEPRQMQPVPAAASWDVPAIETVGALADWFQIIPDELAWFADLKGLAYKSRQPRLAHYHYRVLAKKSGTIRLIESPKMRLKALQRRILSEILDKIPSHPAAHGFVPGRSVKTFIAPHIARRVILKMDLSDFFPSITGARVQAIFRMLGYPESVADLLGGICTNAVPRAVWRGATAEADRAKLHEARLLHTRPHLPQGAPTSPALANICAYRVDCRLSGLARTAGADYTRYADDLAFSGDADFERCVERFSTHAAAILIEEGFSVNHRKTRIMRQGVRQRLVGLVANQHANVLRTDFDTLKATLHNCVRLGADSQNRTAHSRSSSLGRPHLMGRVRESCQGPKAKGHLQSDCVAVIGFLPLAIVLLRR